MPVITPSSESYELPDLKDFEAYKGRLVVWEVRENEYKGKQSVQLQVDLALSEDDNDTLRDWMGLALGTRRSGQVSRLRTFLNALSDKPTSAEIKWFNTDTWEWGYEPYNQYGDQPAASTNKLVKGMEVLFRGLNGVKEDGNRKFSMTTYQSAHEKASAKGKRTPQPAGVSSEESEEKAEADPEIPF
jgi:hypothetical protein